MGWMGGGEREGGFTFGGVGGFVVLGEPAEVEVLDPRQPGVLLLLVLRAGALGVGLLRRLGHGGRVALVWVGGISDVPGAGFYC